MNTGIWFVLEVVFDTLMFAPYVLRGQFSARVKTTILFTYLRLSAKLLLVNPFRPITTERVLGFTVHCFDYRTMHLLFRVILLRNEYYFETTKDRPVIFDCGANIGLATLFFKWLYPRSEIYAFEQSGHFVQFDQPELIVAAIQQLVDRVGKKAIQR